jgi:hypothetical protein
MHFEADPEVPLDAPHGKPDVDEPLRGPHEPPVHESYPEYGPVLAAPEGRPARSGAPDRAELERAMAFEGAILEAPAYPERARNRVKTIAIAAVGLTVVGAVFWYVNRTPFEARPPMNAMNLPAALAQPASAGRPELLAIVNAMDALGAEAERKIKIDSNLDPHVLSDLADRLKVLEQRLQAVRPKVNEEERTVWRAVERAQKQLRAFIISAPTPAPDLDGAYAAVARQQLAVARTLLMSGH